LDQCGKGIFQNMNRDVAAKPLLAGHRRRKRPSTSSRTSSV
jgi:hypothetical protein